MFEEMAHEAGLLFTYLLLFFHSPNHSLNIISDRLAPVQWDMLTTRVGRSVVLFLLLLVHKPVIRLGKLPSHSHRRRRRTS